MLPKVRNSEKAKAHPFDVIVFDFDGVIIDSARDLVGAARHSLRQVGSGEPDFSFVRSCIGGGARNLLLRCLDDSKKDRVDDALNIFRSYYEENCLNQTVLYPGVRELLAFYAQQETPGARHLQDPGSNSQDSGCAEDS